MVLNLNGLTVSRYHNVKRIMLPKEQLCLGLIRVKRRLELWLKFLVILIPYHLRGISLHFENSQSAINDRSYDGYERAITSDLEVVKGFFPF